MSSPRWHVERNGLLSLALSSKGGERRGAEARFVLIPLFPNLEERPHHDTLARLLARIDVLEIEPAHLDMIRPLMRRKKFRRYLIGGGYPIAIDGTQKFARTQCWDAACLERKVGRKKTADPQPAESEKQYYVYVLEANLTFQNGMVIPLLSEVLSDIEG